MTLGSGILTPTKLSDIFRQVLAFAPIRNLVGRLVEAVREGPTEGVHLADEPAKLRFERHLRVTLAPRNIVLGRAEALPEGQVGD